MSEVITLHGDGETPLVLRLAAQLAGLRIQRQPLKGSSPVAGVPYAKDLVLACVDNSWLFQTAAIARFILETGGKSDAVGGKDALLAARINQWVEWATVLGKASDDVMCETVRTVSTALRASKFLCGEHVTLADLVVAGILNDVPCKLPQDINEWLSSVQSSSGVSEKHANTVKLTLGDKFYITTAINYTNGLPHMGHAYEVVLADVIARYHRRFGRNVFFLTGTDEHGQKIAQAAEAAGKTPIQLCDFYAGKFQELGKRLNTSPDFFIRTTMPKHYETAKRLFTRALERGDIYLDMYKGWYNVREETFVTETEAAKTDYKDPTTGKPLTQQNEESYFFRMSKYQQQLIEHIKAHPEFIQPEIRRQDILTRLSEPLLDLSVSRTTFSWGVPVPNDPRHVMYVWFDALTNYLSGVDYPDGKNANLWPADIHIIGKDITWFHTVIWPCMLLSTGVPLPRCVFAHGFVTDERGLKMSKSVGNVIDPNDMLDKYQPDTFRAYLVRETPFGTDLAFSERSLVAMHNSELADTVGNLVHRIVSLTTKFCGGKIPASETDKPFDLARLRTQTEAAFASLNPRGAFELALECVRDTNKYLTDQAPWLAKNADNRVRVILSTLEAIYVAAHFLEPYLPNASKLIFEKLHSAPKTIQALSADFNNLQAGATVDVGDILFGKHEFDEAAVSATPAAAAAAAAGGKGAAAAPAKAAPAASGKAPVTAQEVADLEAAIKTQGDKVRDLKAAKADKAVIKEAVDKLLELKSRLPPAGTTFPAATISPAQPAAAAAPAAAAGAAPSGADLAKLEAEIAAQGDKVRDLKAAKADKDAIKKEVDKLLELKSKLPGGAEPAKKPAKK